MTDIPGPALPGLTTPSSRTLVMGVLNVTPDSFSDGGRWLDPGAAVAHGLELRAQGADLVDVGGESTRPGAERVSEAEELRRTVPVVRALADQGVVVSIDTMRASVARAALEAGAVLLNDVSGGRWDTAMPALVAESGAPFVAMHWRGVQALGRAEHDLAARYDDVVAEVGAELTRALDELVAAGVDPSQVVLDPGLGFSKNAEHNWELLAHLDALAHLRRPVLVGASRKRFLGSLLAGPDAAPAPVEERDDATAAVSTLAALAGVWCVRVHAVRASVDAVRVGAAVRQHQRAGSGRTAGTAL
ncbi:dihydropteroate synthase [Kineosporia succinea]|uniref:Dihydropteroate synthase n=2 Tax=Kineosporia succinea TaxID=84632 RepID=A0ABT9P3Q9_9ACTN|nr:dihydropteroate synthase [Kineosporia succinea]MDP9827039.1 dihydropteroate synthase [Kineosporia succinea]